MDEPKKETGGKEMDELMRKLVRVPKGAIDRNRRRKSTNSKKKE